MTHWWKIVLRTGASLIYQESLYLCHFVESRTELSSTQFGICFLISWESKVWYSLCIICQQIIHKYSPVKPGQAPPPPPSKIFYWLFQGGTSFVDLFLSCGCYAFVRICLYVPCCHLLGKGWPLGSRLRCLTVRLLLSHWYPGSGVVLGWIDSWSLHPYLLW